MSSSSTLTARVKRWGKKHGKKGKEADAEKPPDGQGGARGCRGKGGPSRGPLFQTRQNPPTETGSLYKQAAGGGWGGVPSAGPHWCRRLAVSFPEGGQGRGVGGAASSHSPLTSPDACSRTPRSGRWILLGSLGEGREEVGCRLEGPCAHSLTATPPGRPVSEGPRHHTHRKRQVSASRRHEGGISGRASPLRRREGPMVRLET